MDKHEMTAREFLMAFISEARHNKTRQVVIIDSNSIGEGKEHECIDRTISIAANYAAKYPNDATHEPLDKNIYYDPKHRIVADEMTRVFTFEVSISDTASEVTNEELQRYGRHLAESLADEDLYCADSVRCIREQQFITKSHEEEV